MPKGDPNFREGTQIRQMGPSLKWDPNWQMGPVSGGCGVGVGGFSASEATLTSLVDYLHLFQSDAFFRYDVVASERPGLI